MRYSTRLPDTVGPYRVSRVLGEGGGGVVFLAHGVDGGSPVAVKSLWSYAADKARWLHNEIGVLAILDHDSVIRMVDYGEVNGVPWLATEWVDGRSLLDLLQRPSAPVGHPLPASVGVRATQPLFHPVRVHGSLSDGLGDVTTCDPLEDRLALACQLSLVVAYLHDRGVAHRDLKPSNILLRRDGHAPTLIDFGLSERCSPRRPRRSVTGETFIGTPLYIAPERIRAEAPDVRADLYSLGCILFELFAGLPPFVRSSVDALLDAHLAEPAPRLSEHADVSPMLDELVAGLLDKEPPRRPTAAQAALSLAVLRDGDGSRVRPARAAEPTVPFARRGWMSPARGAGLDQVA